jgi:CrcB protein
MRWWEWVLVGVAGAAGAPLRYMVDTIVSDRGEGVFPYGTLVVNVTGSFVLGLITGLVMYHGLTRPPKLIFGTGLVGAYTTFSTFSFETLQLAEQGESRAALANLAVSVAVGAAAAAAGLAVGAV